MKMKLIILMLGVFAAAIGCDRADEAAKASSSSAAPSRYPYRAVTTVGMVTDVVKQVAREKADVKGLIGEGVDPHLYKPTRNDMSAMMEADVVFYSGLMLEGKMGDVFVKVGRTGKPVFAVTEMIPESYLLQPEEFQGHFDPHVWMDVSAWTQAVEAVTRALGEYDPPNASYYRTNGSAYSEELKKLDAYAQSAIASIPEKSRILITAHDAFNYFGRRYGIQVKGIQGISTESEAGLQAINGLVETIVKNDVKAVFVESSVSDKNVRALVDGAAARGKKVAIGGTLFSDAMGAPGTYEGTYVGMMDHNVTIITRALGGTAPQRGMKGKLAAAASHGGG
jgi:manganese/zinc/iron transport system substrate-binding protein